MRCPQLQAHELSVHFRLVFMVSKYTRFKMGPSKQNDNSTEFLPLQPFFHLKLSTSQNETNGDFTTNIHPLKVFFLISWISLFLLSMESKSSLVSRRRDSHFSLYYVQLDFSIGKKLFWSWLHRTKPSVNS